MALPPLRLDNIPSLVDLATKNMTQEEAERLQSIVEEEQKQQAMDLAEETQKKAEKAKKAAEKAKKVAAGLPTAKRRRKKKAPGKSIK